MKKPGKKIRVAMVAPPFGAIGGPEIVVQNLSYALSKKNVRVTLFAPADWKIKSKKIRHVPTLLQSLWNMADFKNQTPRVRRNLIISSQIQVLFDSKRFDLIHLHSSTYAFLVGKFSKAPCLLSFHNKITLPEYRQIREAGIIPVSLSKWQKGSLKTNIKELVAAAKNTNAFNRKACREYAEKNFSSDVMADKYIRLYNKIVKG